MIKKIKTIKRNCPLCGNKKFIQIYKKNNYQEIDVDGKIYKFDQNYVRCKLCFLIYQNPFVPPIIFNKIYQRLVIENPNHQNSQRLKKHIKFFNSFIKIQSKNSSLMEIGCGTGGLLNYLKKKYKLNYKNVLGLEPSQKLYEYIKNKKLFNVKNLFLHQMHIKKKFDYIILDNVFEHFDYPIKALSKIKKLMHDETIVYFSVPNIYKINNTISDPLNHTCNYVIENLDFLFNSNGLRILNFKIQENWLNFIVKKDSKIRVESKNKNFFTNKLSNKIKKIENFLKKNSKESKKIIKKIKSINISNSKNNQKITVFGASNHSLELMNYLDKKYVLFLVDSNPMFHFKKRIGLKVFPPNYLLKKNFDKVLISSRAFNKEMNSQLKKLKVPKNKIINLY